MSNEPRNHHYVPRSILKNFTIGGEGKQLYVFDKQSGRSFSASVFSAGAERDFNCVQFSDKKYNFETIFQELDDWLALIVNKILKYSSVKEISSDDKQKLPLLIACQLVRTKLSRTTPVEISRQLSELVQELGMPEVETITEEDARRIALSNMLQLNKFSAPFLRKDFILLYSSEERLWISDNPVVVSNSFPYGKTGLDSPGVEIYYPISSNLCMAFYCPSIREMICEAMNPYHPRPCPKDSFVINLGKALAGETTLNIPKIFAQGLNKLQTSQSSRFIYSSDNNFDIARKLISEHPEVANVKSRFALGSSMIPPAPSLHGTWLIAEKKHRHHALPITLVNEKSPFIDFRTSDKLKLAAIQKDCPLDCVTVYKDGRGTRVMNNGLVFRVINEDVNEYIRVEHDNPLLNAIMER